MQGLLWLAENYRRELWATSKLGRYTIESDLLARSLNDLRQGLLQLRQYGDSVASKKQHIEVTGNRGREEGRVWGWHGMAGDGMGQDRMAGEGKEGKGR